MLFYQIKGTVAKQGFGSLAPAFPAAARACHFSRRISCEHFVPLA